MICTDSCEPLVLMYDCNLQIVFYINDEIYMSWDNVMKYWVVMYLCVRGQRSCIRVLRVSFLPLSVILIFDFGIVPTVLYFFFFHFIYEISNLNHCGNPGFKINIFNWLFLCFNINLCILELVTIQIKI